MKLSKLEAYRIYKLSEFMIPLIVRYGYNDSKIVPELDSAWNEYYSKINEIGRDSPTLVSMANEINRCHYLSKYLPSPITQPVE